LLGFKWERRASKTSSLKRHCSQKR
jgi:hypothetical protein